MPINELKILSSDYLGYQIGELSDKPALDGLSAQQLKDRFDALTKEVIVPGFNALVDALLDTALTDSGAQNVGSAAIDGVSGSTVHAQLQSLKALIDSLVVASVENVPAGSITDEKLSDSGADIKERFAAFADGHNHVLADVTDAAAALDGKAATEHTHAIANVNGLQGALDGKSATSHNHAGVYQPAGSYAAASHNHAGTYQPAGSYAAASHTHSIANVSGLQGALDGKASTSAVNAKFDTNKIIYVWATPAVVNGAIWLRPL